jgi:hypothetical protein
VLEGQRPNCADETSSATVLRRPKPPDFIELDAALSGDEGNIATTLTTAVTDHNAPAEPLVQTSGHAMAAARPVPARPSGRPRLVAAPRPLAASVAPSLQDLLRRRNAGLAERVAEASKRPENQAILSCLVGISPSAPCGVKEAVGLLEQTGTLMDESDPLVWKEAGWPTDTIHGLEGIMSLYRAAERSIGSLRDALAKAEARPSVSMEDATSMLSMGTAALGAAVDIELLRKPGASLVMLDVDRLAGECWGEVARSLRLCVDMSLAPRAEAIRTQRASHEQAQKSNATATVSLGSSIGRALHALERSMHSFEHRFPEEFLSAQARFKTAVGEEALSEAQKELVRAASSMDGLRAYRGEEAPSGLSLLLESVRAQCQVTEPVPVGFLDGWDAETLNHVDPATGDSALSITCRLANAHVLSALIEAGASLDVRFRGGRTLWHEVASGGARASGAPANECITLLTVGKHALDLVDEPDASPLKRTPLTVASRLGSLDAAVRVTHALLNAGALPDHTALSHLAQRAKDALHHGSNVSGIVALTGMEGFALSRSLADCTLHVQPSDSLPAIASFPVHRIVLASQSSFFRAMFLGHGTDEAAKWRETTEVSVVNESQDTVAACLRLLYGHDALSIFRACTFEELMAVAALLDSWGASAAFAACRDFLLSILSPDTDSGTLLEVLSFASSIADKELAVACSLLLLERPPTAAEALRVLIEAS